VLAAGTMGRLVSWEGKLCTADRVRGKRFVMTSSESKYSSSLETNLEEKAVKPENAKLSSKNSVSC